MQENMNLDEGVLENLRNIVERDDTKIVNLQTEVRQLKTDVEKKNDKISELEKEAEEDRVVWESATRDILDKSTAIREEYRKALASFRAEPSPFPEEAEDGASGLLDWLLGEFEDLGQILTSVSDNTAVMACESVMATLAHEGCSKLDMIAARDYVFPGHSELEEDIAKVQAVKKSFLRKFWKVYGCEAVREAVQRRLEDVSSSFLLPSLELICCHEGMGLTILLFLCRRSEPARQRRTSWRKELVRRTSQEDPGLVEVSELSPRVMLLGFRALTTLVRGFCVMGGDLVLYNNLLLFFD